MRGLLIVGSLVIVVALVASWIRDARREKRKVLAGRTVSEAALKDIDRV